MKGTTNFLLKLWFNDGALMKEDVIKKALSNIIEICEYLEKNWNEKFIIDQKSLFL